MKIAIVGILIGLAIAIAFVLFDSKSPPAEIDDKHRAAAIFVARCDAQMSSLDAALGSSQAPGAAIASRLDACTRAKAAVERARAEKGSHQLDVAFDRVTQHLARLATLGGSGAGSAPGSAAN